MNTSDQLTARINARALELAPHWQRPNAALEAWAMQQATAEVLAEAKCDFGDCAQPATTFHVSHAQLRPYCDRHFALNAEIEAQAARMKASEAAVATEGA